MPERKLGEITPKQAAVCKELNCPLFQDQKYPQCTVLAQIAASSPQKGAREITAAIYHAQIPPKCPRDYFNIHPAKHVRY